MTRRIFTAPLSNVLFALLAMPLLAVPSHAQSDSGQPVVLHCVLIANPNEFLDIVLDMGRNIYSVEETMMNLPGGNSFHSPAEKGVIQSVTTDEVRFNESTLNRLTGTLLYRTGEAFKCVKTEKVF